MPSTLEKWRGDVSEDFQFTIKLWKEITHIKNLNAEPDNVNTFMNVIGSIGNKKGCLLVQFPASITAQYRSQLGQILQWLYQAAHGHKWRMAIELRSATWYNDETLEQIDRYNASLVLHDMPKAKNFLFSKNSEFFYFRFHGPTGNYKGDYSTGFLEEQAQKIGSLLGDGKDVYVYVNNTMGNAFENAMSLRALVENFRY